MKNRNKMFIILGWWIRFYVGGTMNPKRFFVWKFDGVKGVNRGMTLRLNGENCLGIQWRRS